MDPIEPPFIPPPGTTYITVSAPPVAYTMQAAAAACGLSVSTLRAAVIKGDAERPVGWAEADHSSSGFGRMGG